MLTPPPEALTLELTRPEIDALVLCLTTGLGMDVLTEEDHQVVRGVLGKVGRLKEALIEAGDPPPAGVLP